MKRVYIVFSLLISFSSCLLAQTYQFYADYVTVFAPTAVAQMEEYGVPASITLAQGLLESGAGRSNLSQRANNHFGIKCTSDWTGKTVAHEKTNVCFRAYDNPAESYRDHSLFLRRSRYSSLFELKITDYKGWAHGLKRCGYASDPNYPAKLIKLVEEYGLSKYDKMKLADVPEASAEVKERYSNFESGKKKTTLALPSSSTKQTAQSSGKSSNTTKKNSSESQNTATAVAVASSAASNSSASGNSSMGSVSATRERQIKSVNKCKYIIARKGDTYAAIAEEYKIAERRLRDFNEAGRLSQPRQGERVFLQSKKNRSKQGSHRVVEGETMRSIAQTEGIKLRKLYDYNTVAIGDQPEVGHVLRLKK